MDIKAKLSTLARRLEELEGRRLHEVQAVTRSLCKLSHVSSINLLNIMESNAQLFL